MFNRVKMVVRACAIAVPVIIAWNPAGATAIMIDAADFIEFPTKSNVRTYSFTIEVTGPLAPGGVYNNPALDGVDYYVRGSLVPGTPSGFPAFNLIRAIGGAEFYSQGSSLNFSILPSANLSDGLQLSELAGAGVIFEMNAREVDTGRYHPPILRLNADGTGLLQNSNNNGGTNPATGNVVNVNFGDEYVTGLTFNPADVTIAPPIPLPAAWLLLGTAMAGLAVAGNRWRCGH